MFKRAILIIHGFGGGTYDQELLSNNLELESNFDVFTFTLPGHDTLFSSENKMNNWIKKSEDEVNFLINNGYTRIYVVGHSMGGVIASYLAVKYKQIKRLVLAAPAFDCFFKKESGLGKSLSSATKVLENYNMNEILSRLIKIHPSTLNEFVKLVDKYKKYIEEVDIPVLILHGNKDKVVPLDSSKKIYESIKEEKKKLIILNGVTHDIFRGKKANIAVEEIRRYLKSGIVTISGIEEI